MPGFNYGSPNDNFGIEKLGTYAVPADTGDLIRACVVERSEALCHDAWQRFDPGPLQVGLSWTLLAAIAIGAGFAALTRSHQHHTKASAMNQRRRNAAFAPKIVFGLAIFIAFGFALNVFSNDYGHFHVHPSIMLTIIGLASLSALGAVALVWAIEASGNRTAQQDKPGSNT